MERILIIGCPGSGKSRLARELGQKLGLPVIHLDQLWQKKNRQNVTVAEFDDQLTMALNMDRWIIDGNYSRTMEARLEKCDTVIYLDFERGECLKGLCQQISHNRGMNALENIQWIWNYNKHNRVRNYTYLAKARHAQAVVLKSRKEVRAFLDTI